MLIIFYMSEIENNLNVPVKKQIIIQNKKNIYVNV